MSNKLTLAVVSDIHAFDGPPDPNGHAPSHVSMDGEKDSGASNPLESLHEFVGRTLLKADFLICCGDLTDKARKAPTKYVWNQLNRLASQLKCSSTPIVVPGNHDVDSRHAYSDFDAKGHLQSLRPRFPIESEAECDKFWARHYAILKLKDGVRFVLLNTAAYHGEEPGQDRKLGYDHGRVAASTIEALREELSNDGATPVNILVCHHNLTEPAQQVSNAPSSTKQGQDLLNMLTTLQSGQWLVIHGHTHIADIFYASGGADCPTIFSSASLGALIPPASVPPARNQFHLITLELELEAQSLSLCLPGEVKSWDWYLGTGWAPACTGSGLPHRTGFGFRGNIATLAMRIKRHVSTRGQPYLTWLELEEEVSELRYLLPRDLQTVLTSLRAGGLRVSYDENQSPTQIGET